MLGFGSKSHGAIQKAFGHTLRGSDGHRDNLIATIITSPEVVLLCSSPIVLVKPLCLGIRDRQQFLSNRRLYCESAHETEAHASRFFSTVIYSYHQCTVIVVMLWELCRSKEVCTQIAVFFSSSDKRTSSRTRWSTNELLLAQDSSCTRWFGSDSNLWLVSGALAPRWCCVLVTQRQCGGVLCVVW